MNRDHLTKIISLFIIARYGINPTALAMDQIKF